MRRIWAIATAAAVTWLTGSGGAALASPPTAADGTLTQTEVIDQTIRFAGPNVIIETTIAGSVTGTLSGDVVDRLRLVIHPDGDFTAQGTATCVCTVEDKAGVIELRTTDTGRVVDGTPTFEGRSVMIGGTGELAGLRGVVELEGAVDLTTGLSVINYSGRVHFHP